DRNAVRRVAESAGSTTEKEERTINTEGLVAREPVTAAETCAGVKLAARITAEEDLRSRLVERARNGVVGRSGRDQSRDMIALCPPQEIVGAQPETRSKAVEGGVGE